MEVVRNGIDIEKWIPNDSRVCELKGKLNLGDKKVVLFAARLSGAKGGGVMVDFMEEVVKSVPDTVLLVLGDRNSFVKKIEKEISGRKLEKNILFTGYVPRSEIKNYYALSDVVVVPSIYLDPFPTINLEAMACKKPVVTTCFGGSRELVEDGITGFVINPLDTSVFSGKISYLLKKPNVAEKMGLSGFEKIKKSFSENIWLDKLIKQTGLSKI